MGLTILARKERLAAEHLCQDAAHRPHVDSLSVLLERQHDLRRSVPTSCDVFGHETRVVLLRSSGTRQTKVAHLEIAISVEKQVGGLQVSVKHIGGVHGLQRPQGLVDEVLAVIVGEVLGTDDTVHVGLHQLLFEADRWSALVLAATTKESKMQWVRTYLDQIDLIKCLVTPGLLNVKNTDDVLVVEVAQELHLTQGSQTEHGVVKGRDLLDGNLLARGLMYSRATELVSHNGPHCSFEVRTHQTTP